MKFKLVLVGLGLLIIGFAGAYGSCPSGSCPENSVTNFSGSVGLIGIILIPIGFVWSRHSRRQKAGVLVAPDPMVFLDDLSKRLASAGFQVVRSINVPPYRVDVLAGRSRVEASKFGKISRIIGVLRAVSVGINLVQDFSSCVTRYGLDNPGTILPRGFGGGVIVVPVLVSEDFNEDVKKWVVEKSPPKHWAAFEFPVLVSTRERRAYYYRKTPVWGAAYYRGLRKFVESQIGSWTPPPTEQDPREETSSKRID